MAQDDFNLTPLGRPKTLSVREMTRMTSRLKRRGEEEEQPPENYWRPQTRADCETTLRPCPFVVCRHHLYLDVSPETGSLKINSPEQDFDEMPETCSLDVAERGGQTLEDVGQILNITRERIRQIEKIALDKLKHNAELLRQQELDEF